MEFKVGDRVKVTKVLIQDHDTTLRIGQIGTVTEICPWHREDDYEYWVDVKFDDKIMLVGSGNPNLYDNHYTMMDTQLEIADESDTYQLILADKLKSQYDSFIDVGFSEFQAFELLMKSMDSDKK